MFHLGDRSITSMMTHRSEIEWLDVSMEKSEIDKIIRLNLHSVYPLCDGSMDTILGVVRAKDLYAFGQDKSLAELCKPALFVPENNTAHQVMEKFKTEGISICFIIDEYGGIEGMVTLKDIFEAIVGDIPELDEGEEPEIVQREDGTYWVDAKMHFYDFLTYFDCENQFTELGKIDTLAGFILSEMKHIPKVGEHFHWDKFYFEIVDMDGHRIDKILVSINQTTD